jgi:hypothetical protein
MEKLATDQSVPAFLTSAKDGSKVDDAFSTLLTNIINNPDLQSKINYKRQDYRLVSKSGSMKSSRSQKKGFFESICSCFAPNDN